MGQQTCPANRNDLSHLGVTAWAQEMNRTLENRTNMNKNKGRFNPWDFLKGQMQHDLREVTGKNPDKVKSQNAG